MCVHNKFIVINYLNLPLFIVYHDRCSLVNTENSECDCLGIVKMLLFVLCLFDCSEVLQRTVNIGPELDILFV